MSGFSDQWLGLREPADHRSRSVLHVQLGRLSCRHWHIVDLGCGTGSNYRFLAPGLDTPQQWICIDHDTSLIDKLRSATAVSTDRHKIESRCLDLSDDAESAISNAMQRAQPDACRLVTASALLDLVSPGFIDQLVTVCERADAAALFDLSYDGRIAFSPREPMDERLIALINAHQLRDKGFGAALGPGAHAYAESAFARAGYRTAAAFSDWILTRDDGALQHALIDGWLEAAREQAGDADLFSEWEAQRFAQISSGTLEIVVGHCDLLALPDRAARRS